MRTRFFWGLLVFVIGTIDAAVVLHGNKDAAENQTFSFDLARHDQTRSENQFGLYTYVAAAPAAVGSSGEFAIARVARDARQFVPMAPQTINFNPTREQQEIDGEKRVVSVNHDITNPFYNNGVSFFSWLNGADTSIGGSVEKLVMVAQNDLQTVYFLNNFSETNPKNNLLISAHNLSFIRPGSQNIPDAAGALSSGIVGFTAEAPNVFTAVKPTDTGSIFGDVGSGVVLIIDGFIDNLFNGPVIVDAPTFSAVYPSGNRAAALDITSDFLKINSDLAAIGQVVDMHWFNQLGRLYVALQITGGAGGTDGGRAIAMGRIVQELVSSTNDKGETVSQLQNVRFVLEEIAPAAAFDGLNQIVGAVGPDVQVSIHKIRGMFASTSIPYLIGVGGVGAPENTQRTVFALPLVISNKDQSKIGTIAKKDATPEDFFGKTSGSNISVFLSRGITQQASVPADMPLATDAAVQVGGGNLLNGDIVDLQVYQDTVWVTVQDADGNQLPGIFYSHALFDEEGKIKAWTIWQREAGTVDKVSGMEFDALSANKTFLSADASGNIRTVNRTQWGEGDGLAPVVQATDQSLVVAGGGVQGLFDFIVTSTALDTQTPGLKNISMLVATGLRKVLLFETSHVDAGVVIPNRGSDFGTLESFDSGTITKTFPTGNKMILIMGGVLDSLGAINAAEIARDGAAGANGWLLVGGVGGVAILSNQDGDGWDASTELASGFAGLVSGMAFKTFGDYTFVRKIVNDSQYLYILTDSKLDRIDLTLDTPGLGMISPVTIAQAQEIAGAGGSFIDLVVSEKLALIATSAGLIRISDGQNVQTATNPFWQKVETPEGSGPVRQLIAQSTTGRAQDISKKTVGGTLYVLSAFRGKNQAQIFRYAIQETAMSDISAATVVKLPDVFVKDVPSFFASFGSFRSILATDGALFMGSVGQQLENKALVTALNSLRTVGIYTGFASRPLFNRQIEVGLADTMLISSFFKNSSSGSWLVGTDDGMRINE